MKKVYKILSISFVSLGCLFLVGCGNSNDIDNISNELVEKFNKVTIGMTKSELSSILTPSDEVNGKYENGMIVVDFNGDKVSLVQLQLSYNNEEIISSKTNLKNVKKFKNKLDKGEKFYYQDLVDDFKNDGVCTIKNASGCSQYRWADKDGRYLTVSLNVYSDGYITAINGKY